MANFVRKNIIVCSVVFTAEDGSATQPSAANLVLQFTTPQGTPQRVTISMTYNVLMNVWTAAWDSSASGNGTVFWMAYGYGQLQASAEGSFDIAANAANVV